VPSTDGFETAAKPVREISGSVVRHHALDPDALFAKPVHGAFQKLRDRMLAFVGPHFGVRDPSRIIDAYVQELPADPPGACPAVTGDPVAYPPDTAQALRIQVEELARTTAFITHDHRLRLQVPEPLQTQPSKPQANR
jgi:hypothetical protein